MKTIAGIVALFFTVLSAHAEAPKPVKILIVSGGCCHDYARQRELLEKGLKERFPAQISHVYYDPKPGDKATLAHNIDVMADPRYLDLVARGVLWATGRL